jgi:hypothetical protein
MPARVEYRLGSIFDEACDVLVIPSSAGGTVSPSMAEQMRKEGIPFPNAASWGSVTLALSPVHRFGALAYAATLQGQETTLKIVKEIGQRLGSITTAHRVSRFSAPLLGAGSGDLSPTAAAAALTEGFMETARDTAVLTISIRRPEVFAALRGETDEDARDVRDSAPRYEIKPPRPDDGKPLRSPPTPEKPSPPSAEPPVRTPPPGAQLIGPARPGSKRTRVFISYSHEDAEWLERLQKHLAPLERDGALVWDDTRLKAGARWREEIRGALAETRVAVLLVSADFLASDFIATDELPPLLQAAAEDGATILPVIISPCRFERMESLSRFQAVNDPRKPLVKLRRGNREEVLDAVARAVEDALRR